jgi:hypothetical protein
MSARGAARTAGRAATGLATTTLIMALAPVLFAATATAAPSATTTAPTAAAAARAAAPIHAPAAAPDPVPPWLAAVRDAAYARAHRPLTGEALDAALRERRRAAAGALPSLRLSERSHLGWDGGYRLTLDAGVNVPLLAPSQPADARLTTLRLAITRRQLAADRRAQVRDALAQAAALLAARARARALNELAVNELARTDPAPGPTWDPAPAADAPSRTAVDIRLLLAGRGAQARQARSLRAELARALSLPLPAAEHLAAPPRPGAAPLPLFGALGFRANDLDPGRCLAASDAASLARLSVAERRADRRFQEARGAVRVDLELSGTLEVGSNEPGNGEIGSASIARVAVSVRLPPWSPASGTASLSAGAAGLEQESTLTWPNRAPGPPPPDGPTGDRATDPIDEAEHAVRAQLAMLQGQERDLLRRRSVLVAAGSSAPMRTPQDAYLRATLALQLADVDQALDVTALDAASLCGALPP